MWHSRQSDYEVHDVGAGQSRSEECPGGIEGGVGIVPRKVAGGVAAGGSDS
jgi:hypothetical protein